MMIIYFLMTLVVGSGAAGLYGAYKGYQLCSASYRASILRAENQRLKVSNAYYISALEAAKAEEAKFNSAKAHNDEVISSLQKTIAGNKQCLLDTRWMRRLR